MKHIFTFLLTTIMLSAFSQLEKVPTYYRLNPNLTEADYKSQTLIIKELDQKRGVLQGTPYEQAERLDEILSFLGVEELSRIYPRHHRVGDKKDVHGNAFVDLSLIYQLKFSSDVPIEKAINLMLSVGCFEYVEPLFLHQLLYNPNDPDIGQQYHIPLIQAPQAWDVTKGDTNVVVAITDTGIEKLHSDLVNKIKYNYDDPIDGSDNDGDGYVDNYYGWDIGDGDNDPQVQGSHHGTWVAGLVGAETDNNNKGVGVGFNVKVLPIKIMDSGNTLAQAYPGIIYAADHDVDIINCSWGSANSWSQYGQDVINYATVNKGVLVVAAAGNSNLEEAYYPASYDKVISCATTEETDVRNEWATYHKKVDVCGTGAYMFTATQNDNFGSIGSGSSFSSPVTAGVAALIKSQFPSYTPLQIGEQIKTTTDYIYDVAGNEAYVGKLGTGRVNAYRAVTETSSPSVYLINEAYNSTNGLVFAAGDTVALSGDFYNYLAGSGDLTATLSSASPFINVINDSYSVGTLATLGSVNNGASPFTFEITGGAPNNTEVELIITITDGAYTNTQCLMIVINRDYADMDINNLLMTITSKGRLGYNSANQADGSGLTYQGSAPLFWEMNFMVAHKENQVSFDRDGEFQVEETIQIVSPGIESEKDMIARFNDDVAANKLNISVKHKALAWSDSGNENYIISEFTVVNNDTVNLDSLFPALYGDWDIDVWNQNYAAYDSENHMGYVYYDGGHYGAIKLLTDTANINYYAFDNDGSNGSINIYAGYNESEQFNSASGGLSRTNSGLGDVAHLVGVGPMNVPAGDSVTVAFAIIVGTSLEDLQEGATNAEDEYENIRTVSLTLQGLGNTSCYASCDGTAEVSASFGVPPYSYSWNDPESQISATATGLCAGQYSVTVTDAVGNTTSQNILVSQPDLLEASVDSVYNVTCYGACDGTLDLTVVGGSPSYVYEWSDSTVLSVPNPNLCPGSYSLYVKDANNCVDSITVSISEPSELIVEITDSLGVSTSGACDGEATVTATGGTGEYTYLWDDDDSQITATATGLCEGVYNVLVIDENNCYFEVDVEINNPSGIAEIDASINMYPNPLNNDILFIDGIDSPYNVILYDALGKRLSYWNDVSENQIKLSDIPSGIYYIRIETTNFNATRRLEVVK